MGACCQQAVERRPTTYGEDCKRPVTTGQKFEQNEKEEKYFGTIVLKICVMVIKLFGDRTLFKKKLRNILLSPQNFLAYYKEIPFQIYRFLETYFRRFCTMKRYEGGCNVDVLYIKYLLLHLFSHAQRVAGY